MKKMILHSSYTSPYVRKVKIFLIETGLWARIDEIYTNPDDEAVLRPLNPLGKIPAFETDGGVPLYDSPVICEYLDTQHSGPKLFPAAPEERWQALRLQALADGLADAANLRRNEALRPERGLIFQDFLDRQDLAIEAALAHLNAVSDALRAGPLTIGTIAAAAAMGYINFRYTALPWRQRFPDLAAWFDGFSERPSMSQTMPQNPPGRPAPPEMLIPPKFNSD